MWDLLQWKDNVALCDQDQNKITYQQLEEFGKEISSVIKKRCLIFSLCKNTIGSVAGYVSFLNHKMVPLLLNAHMDRELLDALLEEYRPNYLWIPEENKNDFMQYEMVFCKYEYCLLKAKKDESIELFQELALLLTTSGSTGSPKFVRQSYANISANTQSIVSYLNLDQKQRPITTLPMNYTYGLSIINSHLWVGATILLTEATLLQKEFWEFFKTNEATSFGGVPYTYEILNKLRFYKMELPSLLYMTQAGGKLSPALHKKFAEYALEQHKKFIVMYGQCEATARMSYLPAEKSLEKYGSMGIAIPGGEFKLIDVDGNEITQSDVVGELLYQGENVTLGYAQKREDLKNGDERFKKLKTGDMAKRDEDGYYYIVGRKKRFLKVYGNRVNLDEIDMMIKNKFTNLSCACAGVDDHIYVFVTEQRDLDSLKKYLAEKMSLNKTAFEIKVIDEIPKNDSGKIVYKELEKYYL